MESVVSKIQETGQRIATFARAEGKGWRHFLAQRVSSIRSGARALFTVPAIEQALLARVDGTLKAIDAKVRARLGAIEKRGRKRRAANGTPARRTKKAAATKPAAKSPPSALAGTSVRH